MTEPGLRKQKNTAEHFDSLAKEYDNCRTFDIKPIHHLARVVGRGKLSLCDFGC